MKPSSSEQSIQAIANWNARAIGYRQLTDRWTLLARMADRLVSWAAREAPAVAVDLGAGTGLVTASLLEQVPGVQVHAIEPSPAFLEMARAEFRDRLAGSSAVTAEDLDEYPVEADSVVCNAAFHLVDEERVLPAVARALLPGGAFLANLWWHSFRPTMGFDPQSLWRGPLDAALALEGLPVWRPPKAPPHRVRERGELSRLAGLAGMTLERVVVDRDRVSARFLLDFAAISPEFLAELDVERRTRVLRCATQLATAEVQLTSTRFLFRKTGRVG